MLDLDLRTTILQMRSKGVGVRAIARTLDVSRNTVREVLLSGRAEVPVIERDERLAEHLDSIRELVADCGGNLVRVCEILAERSVEVGYSTLTSFCRRHAIGTTPKVAAGRYHFEPGEEMQHDTSPHVVPIGSRPRRIQCASLVMAYSRSTFMQAYWRFTRFECRAFLSDAIVYQGGAAGRCMIDNTSVIIASGTGKDAVPAPEMLALATRFGFTFEAHAVGDANRSARVERPFHYVENNFYAGRTFESLADLNAQLRAWCDTVNARPKRSLPRPPRELLLAERPLLKSLPPFIPDVYDTHRRRVDVEGYVNLHRNRYSAPELLIGREVEVRESMTKVRLFDGHRLVAEHIKEEPGANARVANKEHHQSRSRRAPPRPTHEESALRAVDPVVAALVGKLRVRDGGRAVRSLRRLYRIFLDYPTPEFLDAVRRAAEFDLIDLARIEALVLDRLEGRFFRFPAVDKPTADEENDK